tara:strand:+ start:4066 stop:4197 length:132 start_codon:yes stop_codon:yes gene_type:complete
MAAKFFRKNISQLLGASGNGSLNDVNDCFVDYQDEGSSTTNEH